MEDFNRQYIQEQFLKRSPEQRREILEALSPEEQCEALARLPPERLEDVMRLLEVQQLRQAVESLSPEERWEMLRLVMLTAKHLATPRKPRRKR
jgi:Mg/Co/Ni transporter MgtE